MLSSRQLRKLMRKGFLWFQALVANSSSIFLPRHDPPTHKCLLYSLIIRLVGEYSQVARALAPFFLHPHLLTPPHLSPHYTMNKMLFLVFPQRLWTRPRLQAFFWFLQIGIPMHDTFINKWSFYNGFGTLSELFPPRRFNEWIPLVVPILFSYWIGSHSTPNCKCP